MAKMQTTQKLKPTNSKNLMIPIIVSIVAIILILLLSSNLLTQKVNDAWVAGFFSQLNSYRISNFSNSLSLCSSLNSSAEKRFITMSQNYQITHYNLTQDVYAFLFKQNISDYSLDQAEDVFTPTSATPPNFFSYTIKNASIYYPSLINSTTRYYGYYIGTANAYISNIGCLAPPSPSNTNISQYYRAHSCSYSVEPTSWVVVELSNKCPTLQNTNTSFTRFKSNFLSAPRIGVVSSFSNLTQLPSEISCYSEIIQYIAHNRNSKTIDFFQMDQRNATCTYAAGLGYPINTSQQSIGKCLSIANSEPSVFLNFSLSNMTAIMPNALHISANPGLLNECEIIAASTLG